MSAAIIKVSPDSEIVSSRIFNFPRPLVFKAWTDQAHLKNWWGPKGFTNTFYEFNLEPGGHWRFMMHGPDKGNYPNECVFVAIQAPEMLVWDRVSKPLFQVEVNFEETAENKTALVFRMKFGSVEECNKLRPFVPDKNEENFDRLEDELAIMAL